MEPVHATTAPSVADPPVPFSGLPAGVALASPWSRLGAYLLESLLLFVTLGIGWLIWAMFTAPTGQTPAKRLLSLRAVKGGSLQPSSMGHMFWVRGIVAGLVASLVVPFTLGIILFMPFWDKNNQNLWDKVSNSYVVDDPNDAWLTRQPAVLTTQQ